MEIVVKGDYFGVFGCFMGEFYCGFVSFGVWVVEKG